MAPVSPTSLRCAAASSDSEPSHRPPGSAQGDCAAGDPDAVDPDAVWMTTRLDSNKTFFLPFNKGHNEGEGNPPVAKPSDCSKAERKLKQAKSKVRKLKQRKENRNSVFVAFTAHSLPSQRKEFLEAGKKRLAGDTAREATSDEVKEGLGERARELTERLRVPRIAAKAADDHELGLRRQRNRGADHDGECVRGAAKMVPGARYAVRTVHPAPRTKTEYPLHRSHANPRCRRYAHSAPSNPISITRITGMSHKSI